jgi:hypothetical protein
MRSIPFVNDTTIQGNGSFALWGGNVNVGVVGVEVLCSDAYATFPGGVIVQWRVNGGAWNNASTDGIGPANNYRGIPVTQAGDYDVQLLNTYNSPATIKAGVVVRVTVA